MNQITPRRRDAVNHLSFFIIALFFLLAGAACVDDYDDYSTNPRDLLSFSVDTLAFDTVLTTVNSPVFSFKVYNRNEKPLLISRIETQAGEQSVFKINVDGMAGTRFSDVEIRANDSLFVFVDIKPGELESDELTLIRDYVYFRLNGIQQQVVLDAYGQNITPWKGKVIEENTTLDATRPYLIMDSLVVARGVELDIPAGVTFYMHGDAEVMVYGSLRANGTLEAPVTFRGARTDKIIGISYDLYPGQWGGLRFDRESSGNELNNVRLRNGKYGIVLRADNPDDPQLVIRNSVLTNVQGKLIDAVNTHLQIENSELSNSKEALFAMTGGRCSFMHCTLANYYYSDLRMGLGNSNNETVMLAQTYGGEEGASQQYPILRADFTNCIIAGKNLNSTSRISIEKSEEHPIPYRFVNCLLPNKDDGKQTEQEVDCLYNVDPEFAQIEPTKDGKYYLRYNFRLTDQSPVLGKANLEMAERYPLDLDGQTRLADNQPDQGAYEYVPLPEETDENE